MPCEASIGAHAAAGPKPPPEPPNATTAGKGPGPAGRANRPSTPGSRTGLRVVPGASRCRSSTTSEPPPDVSARTRHRIGAGAGCVAVEVPTCSPDHHRPKGSIPSYVPRRLGDVAVSIVPVSSAWKVPVASYPEPPSSTRADTTTSVPGRQPVIRSPAGLSMSGAVSRNRTSRVEAMCRVGRSPLPSRSVTVTGSTIDLFESILASTFSPADLFRHIVT